MPPSLLSLPDELLDPVVDQAAGEYAPRLYKERQETCRALSLVNKRVGAVAQPKLVEVVHAFAFTPFSFRARLKPQQVPRRNRVRTLWLDGVGLNGSVDGFLSFAAVRDLTPPGSRIGLKPEEVPQKNRVRTLWLEGVGLHCPVDGFLSFAAVRDLRLTMIHGVRLEDLGQLPELRTLVLSLGDFTSNMPLIAPRLERLAISSCDFSRPVGMKSFTAKGCPSLRHLYAAMSPKPRPLWTRDLVARVDTLGVKIYYDYPQRCSWTSIVGPGDGPEDEVFLDNVLFDLLWCEIDHQFEPKREIEHLRLHVSSESIQVDSTLLGKQLAIFAGHLSTAYPALKSLYLPLALDTSRVMHRRELSDAVEKLVAACTRPHVEVVFEHVLEADENREDRASPHFEAHCRRIKAERAASRASLTMGGASAAR
ncbi:uncharacterized protein RHOBADRAFT_43744 [Rhodotorula graminis WP1]|uniref:F-box domain-containing protein n=1 Tax=Rhodotorula graminis (strain WP1) TaxID=578459 RepID=A0A194S763_RHOGW|nr:uncharacterized protein RHOBADRAFT_43744 [Rhodotorula graminis WP1]KPV75256.1 hypothetical protein RHOBADRAFT_43744 [Rhodotorula graminis WP1]